MIIEQNEPSAAQSEPLSFWRSLRTQGGAWNRRWKRFQRVFVWGTLAYAVLLCTLLLLLEYQGESGIILSALLFLPAWGWIIPSLVQLPVCLVVKARLLPLHCVIIAGVLWGYMGYETNDAKGVAADITIMSYNYGQRRGTEIDDFVSLVRPDVIAFQDAPKRIHKYRRLYPDFFAADIEEFLVVSRYPVGAASPISFRDGSTDVVAARFEVLHPHRRFAVYVIHLPTPRHELASLRSSRLGGMAPGRRVLSREGRRRYRDFLEMKRGLANDVLLEMKNDSLPCLLIGDCNTPPHGVIYHDITATLTDAFDEAGSGYGYTFPGDVSRAYAFRKPWLRIDYIFYCDGWDAVDFITEQDRKTQHRAIAARLVFKQ